MSPADNQPALKELAPGPALLRVVIGAAAFQLAYTFHPFSFLIALFIWALFELTRVKSAKQVSYLGLLLGMLAYAPQMAFMWTIFGPAAIALWLVLAFWLRMFLALGRACRVRFGPRWAALLMPFLWTGFEYFRSELYYLRFSWLNAGYVFAHNLGGLPMNRIGVYGMGFLLMGAVALLSLLEMKKRIGFSIALMAGLACLTDAPLNSPLTASGSQPRVAVAGVQMEFPGDTEVLFNLNQLIKQYPDAQLLVLSEYTFTGPVPEQINAWCRKHQRYLVVGAKDPAANSADYYDTAFVIGPSGEIAFRQGKCVPIQFFQDGLPAKEQKLWDSPWGKIGFCVCYDLSYSRVTDQLIRLGAQAIIVPTMDVSTWGLHQHELHARVAPIRAAEYGVPIFRLASSGISQCVNGQGLVEAIAPMPGDGAMISGTLRLPESGSLPWDRVIAPLSVAVTGLMIVWLTLVHFLEKCRRPRISDQP